MKKALLTIGTVILTGAASAQVSGDLDLTFGINGYVMSNPVANKSEKYWELLTLSNDKIVKVGYTEDGGGTDILIARFLADGTPDITFNSTGFLILDLSIGGNEDARGVCEIAGGQLLVTGFVQAASSLDAYVMRVNENGSIDDSFGTSFGHTKLNTGDNMIAYGKSVVYSAGEIYVGGAAMIGGQSDLFVCNLTAAGGVDVSFATSGFATKDIAGGSDHMRKMELMSNGSFVFGGYADSSGVIIGYVAALSQFGTPTTFGTNGAYHVNFQAGPNEVNDLYIDANNNIVLVGDEGTFPNVDGFVLRLTSAGTLDGTFGTGGVMMSDPGATTALFFRGVAETLDGGIVAAGNFDGASKDLYAMLLTANGSPNSGFGGNGDVIIPMTITINSLSAMDCDVQSDGKIVMGGYLASPDFVGENMFMIRLIPFAGLGMNEMTEENVTVYPNPVSSEFKIGCENVENVELIDLNGRTIKTWSAQFSYDLPVDLTAGIYLVKVTTKQSTGLTRIMVK